MKNVWLIIKLSWKNIWRNKTRSSVVIIAVILGTWAGTFMSAFYSGMTSQLINNQLENYTAHIQIHSLKYKADKLPSNFIPSADSLMSVLRTKPFIKSVTARSVVSGLASTSSNTYGVTITGINPETEPSVSKLNTHLIEGDYFTENTRNPIVIGEKLADRLKLSIRSKVVLNFQDVDGNIAAGAFRVSGIFKSSNSSFDESNVYVRDTDLNRIIDKTGAVHEFAILLNNFRDADTYAQQIGIANPNLAVESWGLISPTLVFQDTNIGFYLYIFMVIILVALAFGIVNTMLMAVLERQQELGMLMAIGISKPRIFSMIVTETFFLSIFGSPIGLSIAWLSISYFANAGIDLGSFAEGLESYGYSAVIYPALALNYYLIFGFMIIAATIIASIYPSYKALKLNPVEAIRKI